MLWFIINCYAIFEIIMHLKTVDIPKLTVFYLESIYVQIMNLSSNYFQRLNFITQLNLVQLLK